MGGGRRKGACRPPRSPVLETQGHSYHPAHCPVGLDLSHRFDPQRSSGLAAPRRCRPPMGGWNAPKQTPTARPTAPVSSAGHRRYSAIRRFGAPPQPAAPEPPQLAVRQETADRTGPQIGEGLRSTETQYSRTFLASANPPPAARARGLAGLFERVSEGVRVHDICLR